MKAISVGRIVTKVMGREAGRKAVVTQLIDRNFVEITGPVDLTGIKRRRVNINHICLLYTSPSPRDATLSRMPSSA